MTKKMKQSKNQHEHSSSEEAPVHTKATKAEKKKNDNNNKKKNKPAQPKKLPVTLLSGFLGAGKTTLLKHILESNEHGRRIAVIVNDMAALNIDAALIDKQQRIVQTKAELVAMQNGCICCTLRTDLIREIARIQSLNAFDLLVIESTGLAEPMQVAEAFCTDPETGALPVDPADECEDEEEEEDHHKKEKEKEKEKTHKKKKTSEKTETDKPPQKKMLFDLARLDTCVTVVDAQDFPVHAQSLQTFKERFPSEMDNTSTSGDAEGDGEGDKNIGQLLIEQVEFANVLIVNKTDLISEEALQDLLQLLRTLNPQAHILPATYSRVDLHEILDTGRFDLEAASSAAGWLQSLRADAPAHSEKDEYGVSSFVYRARKPFHPYKLQRFVDKIFAFSDVWEESKGRRRNS